MWRDPTPAVSRYFGCDPEHCRHAWSHEIAGNLHLERIYGSTVYGSGRGFLFSMLLENQLLWEQDHPEAPTYGIQSPRFSASRRVTPNSGESSLSLRQRIRKIMPRYVEPRWRLWSLARFRARRK